MSTEILIIDDNPDIRIILNDLISDAGYKTRVAANFNQALKEIDKKIPDVAILDVKLLVPFFIGSGSLLYPLAIGPIIAPSNAMLNLKIALLVPSKHSSDACISADIKNAIEKNEIIYFLNFISLISIYIIFLHILDK